METDQFYNYNSFNLIFYCSKTVTLTTQYKTNKYTLIRPLNTNEEFICKNIDQVFDSCSFFLQVTSLEQTFVLSIWSRRNNFIFYFPKTDLDI